MAVSQNGYAANDISRTQVWTIPGTVRNIRLRKGSPGALLVRFAAWFDKNVEDIEAGQLDDWGYAERNIRGSDITLSNHASGTAMDLNASKHPLGVRGTFQPAQAEKIRAELKKYEGCIRWGGDYQNRPDEMHFEIVQDPATCDRVLAKLSTPPVEEDDMPYTQEQIRAMVQAELEEYGKRLFGAGGSMNGLIQKIAAVDEKLDKLIAALPKQDTP